MEVSTDVTNAVIRQAMRLSGSQIFNQRVFGLHKVKVKKAGTGSGVIYKKSGDKAYIVTNNHVIEGADQLDVTLADRTGNAQRGYWAAIHGQTWLSLKWTERILKR